jgi:radical SAM protein with 4Fe4S-binding SPASM domain
MEVWFCVETTMQKKKPTVETGSRKFHEPGFLTSIKDALFGRRLQFDCLQVEVSSRCHGRCSYCPHTTMAKEWRGRDMSMDTFVHLQPLMHRSARVHLQGWGEPFLNPAFFTMAAMAKKAGCKVSTTTCGTAMDSERAQSIIASGMDIVAFSLVGSDAASNAQRRGIDFDQVCRAIASLRAARDKGRGMYLEIHLAYLLLASNIEALAGLPALMQRLGVDSTVVSTLHYLAAPSLERETISPEDEELIGRTATALRQAGAAAERLGLGFHYQFPRPISSENGCRENIGRSLFVSANGSISPCVFVNIPADIADPNRRIFGNVHEKSPVEIWESDEYQLFRERLGKGDPDFPCRTCPKRFHQ